MKEIPEENRSLLSELDIFSEEFDDEDWQQEETAELQLEPQQEEAKSETSVPAAPKEDPGMPMEMPVEIGDLSVDEDQLMDLDRPRPGSGKTKERSQSTKKKRQKEDRKPPSRQKELQKQRKKEGHPDRSGKDRELHPELSKIEAERRELREYMDRPTAAPKKQPDSTAPETRAQHRKPEPRKKGEIVPKRKEQPKKTPELSQEVREKTASQSPKQPRHIALKQMDEKLCFEPNRHLHEPKKPQDTEHPPAHRPHSKAPKPAPETPKRMELSSDSRPFPDERAEWTAQERQTLKQKDRPKRMPEREPERTQKKSFSAAQRLALTHEKISPGGLTIELEESTAPRRDKWKLY